MIKLNHADKYYNRGSANELHVMNDINLELPETGMIAVFGESGCGKTTLLNTIGGLDRLNSGEITVFGEDISVNTDEVRNKFIGYIFQNYNLLKSETVFNNVAYALRLCGITDETEIRQRVMAALTSVGMERFVNRLPDTLSGGQQQRVAIARAVVKNPAILLADEPTGNLDEANTILIMNILKQISREHLVILVTHEANLVDYYCERVIEIVDGKVNSVRDNAEANGYSARNKNDVYLGELPKYDARFPGVHIEYYGEPGEDIELRIVSIEGKLYLKSDSPKLKIIDDASEIRFREGVFEKSPSNIQDNINTCDMSLVKPIAGKGYGKLFSFKLALLSGYREAFAKNSKKSKKFLRVCMFMLACVMVFMSASFAVGIKQYAELKENHNDRMFFIPITDVTDTTPVSEHIGENGIDYARVIGSNYLSCGEAISFETGSFITASENNVTAVGTMLDAKLAEDLKLVCGTKDFIKPLDVLITTALADDLIESSSVSYISDYSDLLNMISKTLYDNGSYMRITGVVESREKNYYLNSIYATYIVMRNVYGNQLALTPESMDEPSSAKLDRGTVRVMSSDDLYALGDSVTIMGESYTVSEVFRTYFDLSQYESFVHDKYGIKLLDAESYMKQTEQKSSVFEWFFDYYTQYYRECISFCTNPDILAWMYLDSENILFMIESAQSIVDSGYYSLDLYNAYLFKQTNGHYPSDEELKVYMNSESGKQNESEYNSQKYELDYKYYDMYDEYIWKNQSKANGFIMNDEDYISLAYTTGKNDAAVCAFEPFGSFTTYYGEVIYDHYLLIHASDVAAASAFLSTNYKDALITPDMVYEKSANEHMSAIAANWTGLAVVILLICLCMFFIMRSSLMNRVREIGIYRAIGVSKRNLIFRFMIESLVLSTVSFLIGFVIASAFVMKLSDTILFSETFYYPLWLALLLLAFLYVVALLSGTIPVRTLLRKTPSEIIAKYDI